MYWPVICYWHTVVLLARFVWWAQAAANQTRVHELGLTVFTLSKVSSELIITRCYHRRTPDAKHKSCAPPPSHACRLLLLGPCHMDGFAEGRACDWWRTTPEQRASGNVGSWLACGEKLRPTWIDLLCTCAYICMHFSVLMTGLWRFRFIRVILKWKKSWILWSGLVLMIFSSTCS